MSALAAFCRKYREVILYLAFGSLTTVIGGGVYYLTLIGGRALLGIPADEIDSARYFALYTAAQLLQWGAAVISAFFTNRAWVFTDADREGTLGRQFLTFCGGRVLTLILDYLITAGVTMGLCWVFPAWMSIAFWGHTWNLCELSSKLIAAVVVIVTNYFISKLFVFQKKR